ncbi:F-type H+-transporting ATPase subunit gamma [Breoghania corrubedonensis]|uniref:F-type H+-transporting ATPase subunit gamma n=1 Tax=Breoghania corrubedonensis TaxID=665038 RepID=A0A2T5VBF5_9HYPH|nr:FoF1 ATP synthase subunit gamma [Breoghania corrubedonensis]PTW61079.1 F-type H+-transporting ATPase subunit gamma [Breoghania corrubedonensis]
MTERLADIGARISGVHQLDAVVNAMRGIAAVRVQQARRQIVAVDSYTTTITAAMGRIVAGVPPGPDGSRLTGGKLALVVFCAEQGFAGAFSEHIFDAISADLEKAELFLIGTRGHSVASERAITPAWTSALPAHSPAIPKLANTICNTLYERINAGVLDRLEVVFSTWETSGARVVRRRLFPIDHSQITPMGDAQPPVTNLPAPLLLETLGADYVHALLCNAALHSFVAENEARIAAMAQARGQIESQLAELTARERHIRQEAITAEIIELATGELASRDDKRRRPD